MAANIIHIHKVESKLIQAAIAKDKRAQKKLYDLYASKMLSVCRYYISDVQFAEDVMIQGFYKAFTRLNQYQGKSSFYTWLSRIMSNECIDFLRLKQQKFLYAPMDENIEDIRTNEPDTYELESLEMMIDALPDGCKIVFNLYVLENMKHQEIAEKLEISIGTSKSQLSYARKVLKQQLKKRGNESLG